MKANVSLVALLALCVPTSAQSLIGTLDGDSPGDRFGHVVAFVGDLNGDGHADFAVGAPGGDDGGLEAGSVTIFSGSDFAVLRRWNGSAAGALFGTDVDCLSDVSGDGVQDVIVGAPGADQALVYSGANGSLLLTIQGAAGTEFGSAVADAGDVNGDWVMDFAVGATSAPGLSVFSGASGNLLWSRPEVARTIARIGHVDEQEGDDLITGNYQNDQFGLGNHDGRARLYSGNSGGWIRDHLASTTGDQVGYDVAGVGDVDGDGKDDYVFGAPNATIGENSNDPFAQVRSGADGSLLHEWSGYPQSEFGGAVAPSGDVNLDGVPDILVSQPGERDEEFTLSYLYIYCGDTGATMMMHPTISHGGQSLDGGQDVDGDGWLDFLSGNPDDDSFASEQGSVYIYTYGCPPEAVSPYCVASPNSTGMAGRMQSQGIASIAVGSFVLWADQLPANKPGLFFYGSSATQQTLGDGQLCVTGGLFRLPVVNTGSTGVPSHALDFGSPPNAGGQIDPGQTWYFSFWFRDPAGGSAGYNFADGLKVTFCP